MLQLITIIIVRSIICTIVSDREQGISVEHQGTSVKSAIADFFLIQSSIFNFVFPRESRALLCSLACMCSRVSTLVNSHCAYAATICIIYSALTSEDWSG